MGLDLAVPLCARRPLLIVALLSHTALAWQPGDPWFIAALTTNPAVKPALAEAETNAAAKEYAAAAARLGTLLSSTNPVVCEELARARDPQPPLRLLALAARAQYLQLDSQWIVSDTLCAEAERALAEFAPAARGKNWQAYGVLLETALSYHTRQGDHAAAARVFDMAFASGPLPPFILRRYAAWAPAQSIATNVIRARITSNLVTMASLGARDALRLIPLLHESKDAVIAATLVWLDTWPGAPPADIRQALVLITERVDPAKPEQLRRYHAALATLALRQPGNDDERVEVIAYALNERKKLEVLAPTVFPATEPQ